MDGSGKILKINLVLREGISVEILTMEGEVVLDVKESGLYYPRANISSRKNTNNPLSGEVQDYDYFYFSGELIVKINSDMKLEEEISVDELSIIYDDLTVEFPKIL